MTETQRNMWLQSLALHAHVNEVMQEFFGVRYEISEQHKEVIKTRQSRDVNYMLHILQNSWPWRCTCLFKVNNYNQILVLHAPRHLHHRTCCTCQWYILTWSMKTSSGPPLKIKLDQQVVERVQRRATRSKGLTL